MPKGFTLLDSALGVPLHSRNLFEVVGVRFGFEPYRQLQIELLASGWRGEITFDYPVSFRAHDEGEIIAYWTARAAEDVGVGTCFRIAKSDYLSELSQGVSGLHEELTHYLVAGLDLCVEVLSTSPPTAHWKLIDKVD
ncbi:MAG: hypothetical protein Q7J28_02200 [Caulobacter sp.]|nr:hypothetical protein [Caulobacter sp.]